MSKGLDYYISKMKTLRSAHDELLREMETELKKEDDSKVPRSRQNLRDERKMKYKIRYSKK